MSTPSQNGADIVNGVADRVRAELFRRIGLVDLISPRMVSPEVAGRAWGVMTNDRSPASRTWFITGTSSGFGRALAERLLAP